MGTDLVRRSSGEVMLPLPRRGDLTLRGRERQHIVGVVLSRRPLLDVVHGTMASHPDRELREWTPALWVGALALWGPPLAVLFLVFYYKVTP